MIDGFSIAGYRSFGKSEVRIADLSRVNIFIGKNNCGKSNILRFLKRIGVALKRPPSPAPKLDESLDFYLAGTKIAVSFGLQIKKNGFTTAHYSPIEQQFNRASPRFAERLGDNIWLRFNLGTNGPANPTGLEEWVALLKERLNAQESNRLTHVLCNYRQGDPAQRYSW